MKTKNYLRIMAVSGILTLFAACSSDFLNTKPNELLSEESVSETMLNDPSKVQAFITGAYYNLYSGGIYYTNHDNGGLPAIRLATDLMSEAIGYPRTTWFNYDYFMDNRMSDYRRTSGTWRQLYNVIDNVNKVIEEVGPEEGQEPASDAIKIMLGEAYSLRAYCYYWLINMFQHPYNRGVDQLGIPIKTESVYRQERVPVGEVYTQILSDIEQGYNYLAGEGFHSDKVGISEYTAAAIYANALMFTGDYANAALYAERAIAGGTLNSTDDMLSGFNSLNMPEVIWGYSVNNESSLIYASFFSHVDTYSAGYGGSVGGRKLIASNLYDQIADDDIRKQWFGYSSEFNWRGVNFAYEVQNGFDIYLQKKFVDIYITTGGSSSAFSSDVIYMRIAEMYFVAAEAYYLNGNEARARELLNTIMATRIPGYSYAGGGTELYDEICIQKQIETWLEGCRLFDAKRRGETIDRSTSRNHSSVLPAYNAVTYNAVTDNRMIYQIPDLEIQNNPEITENNP